MPLVRYFLFVGGALLALLFISDAYLPKLPVAGERRISDLPAIRIHSDRKWPERVVFDTSQPTIVPPQTASQRQAGSGGPPQATVADVSAKARVREAFAQLQPSDRKRRRNRPDPKKPEKNRCSESAGLRNGAPLRR